MVCHESLAEYQDALDRFFHIKERGSTIATELRAGLTSFLTLSYILLVHPQVLAKTGMEASDVVTATCLSSGLATLLVALAGNLPFVMAPGLGLSAYFTHGLVLAEGSSISWELALGCVLVAGLALLLLSLTSVVEWSMKRVPDFIKTATIVGIGLLLARIGFEASGLLSDGNFITSDWKVWLSLAGLMAIALMKNKGVMGGIVIGVAGTALVYWIASANWPAQAVGVPTLKSTWAKVLFAGMPPGQAIAAVSSFLLVMLVDCSGCLIALGMHAGIISDVSQRVPGASITLVACSLGTILAALTGSTPVIIALESTAGILEGGRTGLCAATSGLLLLTSLFFAPLFGSIPELASAGVLILIGSFMIGGVKDIAWDKMAVSLPSFLVILSMPLSMSIPNGIVFGGAAALLFAIADPQFWRNAYNALGRGGGNPTINPMQSDGDSDPESGSDPENGVSASGSRAELAFTGLPMQGGLFNEKKTEGIVDLRQVSSSSEFQSDVSDGSARSSPLQLVGPGSTS